MEKNARFKDCGSIYLLCFIFAIGVSFVITGIISSVASSEGVIFSDVAGREWVNFLNVFLSEFVFVIAFFIIVLIRKDKNFLKTYKIKFKFDFKVFLGVFVLGIFTMLCSLNLTNLINLGFSYISPVALSDSLGVGLGSFGQFLLAVLFFAIVPSVCEELVFRGVIYNGLRQRFSYKVAIILSAVMFVLMHLSIYKSFYQIILGIILGFLIFNTGTVFYGIVFHFANNFSIIFFNYIFGGSKVLEFTSWGFKEILISFLIFAIGVVGILLFFKWLNKRSREEGSGFDLECDLGPIDKIYAIDDVKLSYEQKILLNDKKNEGFALFIISVALALILWSFNSFGGFM